MQKPANSAHMKTNPQRPEHEKWKTINKATVSQLGIQIRLLDGSLHTWPYSRLGYHTLVGGTLTIWFSAHIVTVRGRHLQEADDGLRLQSLVSLSENGTRRKDKLGNEEIPEDQPAIDSIYIKDRKDE